MSTTDTTTSAAMPLLVVAGLCCVGVVASEVGQIADGWGDGTPGDNCEEATKTCLGCKPQYVQVGGFCFGVPCNDTLHECSADGIATDCKTPGEVMHHLRHECSVLSCTEGEMQGGNTECTTCNGTMCAECPGGSQVFRWASGHWNCYTPVPTTNGGSVWGWPEPETCDGDTRKGPSLCTKCKDGFVADLDAPDSCVDKNDRDAMERILRSYSLVWETIDKMAPTGGCSLGGESVGSARPSCWTHLHDAGGDAGGETILENPQLPTNPTNPANPSTVKPHPFATHIPVPGQDTPSTAGGKAFILIIVVGVLCLASCAIAGGVVLWKKEEEEGDGEGNEKETAPAPVIQPPPDHHHDHPPIHHHDHPPIGSTLGRRNSIARRPSLSHSPPQHTSHNVAPPMLTANATAIMHT